MKSKNRDFRQVLDDVLVSLSNLNEKDFSEEVKGIIWKLGDTIRINSLIKDGKESDFIDFEKLPDIPGAEFLEPLIEGIREKKVLEIYYQPFYEEKPYFIRVHPYLLKEYHFRWYLIGLNETKREIRTYGLDRIWEVKSTNLLYIQKNFKSKDYFKNTVGIISPAGEPPPIRVEVLKPQAFYLITQPIHPSQSIESEDETKILFNYRVHPTYEFKALLLSLGSDIKVLEPASLQGDIIKELKEAIRVYNI